MVPVGNEIVECRAGGDIALEGRVLCGTVVKYGETANLGRFRETIAPRALSVSKNARLNVQHQRHALIARIGAGLTFEDKPEALEMRAELPDTGLARDTYEAVQAGLLRGLSAEFVKRRDRWEGAHRTIESGELRSVAVVDIPAYEGSELEARAARDLLTAWGLWSAGRQTPSMPMWRPL